VTNCGRLKKLAGNEQLAASAGQKEEGMLNDKRKLVYCRGEERGGGPSYRKKVYSSKGGRVKKFAGGIRLRQQQKNRSKTTRGN